jgi:hypothetical protein
MIRVIKNALYFIFGFVITVALILGIPIAVWWAWDVHNDRRHTLSVNSSTPVFVGNGNGDCGGDSPRLSTVPDGTHLKVRRIIVWKDCATIDVTLPDGQQGHIVYGVGDVSLYPPLSRY